jgi:hypothetical protein
MGTPIEWSATTLSVMQVIDIAAVVIIGPNVLRTFCLHFISSNMHYYGDIEPGNVMQQCQVLNPGGCGRCRRSASTSAAATAFIISW